MTLLCIIFAVFLVTAVFSMADMMVRMEAARLTEKHDREFSFQTIMDTTVGQNLILIAGVLFLLILLAGVLMISGSINSMVAQRTKFFGTMRCGSRFRRNGPRSLSSGSARSEFCDPDAPLKKGDTIRMEGEELTVAGMLKYDLFSEDGLSHGRVSVITSDETFVRLTGIADYALVMIQTTGDDTDEDVAAISGILGEAFRK